MQQTCPMEACEQRGHALDQHAGGRTRRGQGLEPLEAPRDEHVGLGVVVAQRLGHRQAQRREAP